MGIGWTGSSPSYHSLHMVFGGQHKAPGWWIYPRNYLSHPLCLWEWHSSEKLPWKWNYFDETHLRVPASLPSHAMEIRMHSQTPASHIAHLLTPPGKGRRHEPVGQHCFEPESPLGRLWTSVQLNKNGLGSCKLLFIIVVSLHIPPSPFSSVTGQAD